MKKPKLNEVVYEVIELGESSFPSSVKLQDLDRIFEKLKFGEVVIKVINGEIESIQVTHHYKPVILDETLDTEEKKV
ncbi:MAG TPA: hypothetical protein PLT50_02670 [bacterium]|jgi:hypothetical protein|nr:hypothetical protein [bacterium]